MIIKKDFFKHYPSFGKYFVTDDLNKGQRGYKINRKTGEVLAFMGTGRIRAFMEECARKRKEMKEKAEKEKSRIIQLKPRKIIESVL